MLSVVIGFFVGPMSREIEAKGFLGPNESLASQNFKLGFTGKENFFSVFAVFFPATTGILAGVNISGDLRDAQKAIPKGTFLAIGVTGVVYVILAVMAGSCTVRDVTGSVNDTLTCSMMESDNMSTCRSHDIIPTLSHHMYKRVQCLHCITVLSTVRARNIPMLSLRKKGFLT